MFKFSLSVILFLFASSACIQGQQPGPVAIEFPSHESSVHGRVFPAGGADLHPTLLLVPGWPGNANDVVGLGDSLPRQGINVVMFNPRGMWASEGSFSFANTLEDIGAALQWLDRVDVRQRFKIDPDKLTLGGHSYGGGMAMAYAAKDPRIRKLISISPWDTGEFIRGLQSSPVKAEAFRKNLSARQAPNSPVRIDNIWIEAAFRDLSKVENVYGLRDNVPNLADRSILLIGGWEDGNVTVDETVLPLYRALKRAQTADVTFLVYHADHRFGAVQERLASDIRAWLLRGQSR